MDKVIAQALATLKEVGAGIGHAFCNAGIHDMQKTYRLGLLMPVRTCARCGLRIDKP